MGYILSANEKENIGKISAALNAILDIPETLVVLEEHEDARYKGSHDIVSNTIFVNEKLWTDYMNESVDYLKAVNLMHFIATMAHEKRHFWQSINDKEQFAKDTIVELAYYSDFDSIEPEVYLNLPSEIDARAFQALIEERLIGQHWPLQTQIKEEVFNKRLEELKTQYGDRIEKVIQPLYK